MIPQFGTTHTDMIPIMKLTAYLPKKIISPRDLNKAYLVKKHLRQKLLREVGPKMPSKTIFVWMVFYAALLLSRISTSGKLFKQNSRNIITGKMSIITNNNVILHNFHGAKHFKSSKLQDFAIKITILKENFMTISMLVIRLFIIQLKKMENGFERTLGERFNANFMGKTLAFLLHLHQI